MPLRFRFDETSSLIRLLWSLLGPSKLKIVAASLATAAALVVVESAFALVMQSALATLGLFKTTSGHLPDWVRAQPWTPLALFVLLAIARSALMALKSLAMHWTVQTVVANNRREIFKAGIHSADKLGLHEVVEVFNEKVNAAAKAESHFINVLIMGVTTGVLFVVGLRLAAGPLLVSLALLGLLYIPLQYLNSTIRRLGDEAHTESLQTTQLLVQGLRQNFFLRAYNLIDQEVHRANMLLAQNFRRALKYQALASLKTTMPIAGGMILLILTTYYFTRHHTSDYDLLAFFYLFLRLNQGVMEVSHSVTDILFHSRSVLALKDYKTTHLYAEPGPNKLHSKADTQGQVANVEKLQFENVTFGYHVGRPLFKNLSVQLSPGDFWCIQGPSGVGKSSIVSLILGIHAPLTGTISLNGTPLSRLCSNYLEKVGYSGADPYLIPDTLKNNLLFGHPSPRSIGENEILDALEAVELDKVIASLHGGLEEKLNELPTISTGQRQRISLARALLRRPSLLILDEATSHLDLALEERILERLRHDYPNQIVVFISHRHKANTFCTQNTILESNS